MSVKRTGDPAGLLGDQVHVDVRNGVTRGDRDALYEVMRYNSPRARIDRLRKHPELIERADRLAAQLVSGSAEVVVDGKRKFNYKLEAEIAAAETMALYLAAAPAVISTKKLKLSQKRPRDPELDAWIEGQLRLAPDAKSPELFTLASQAIRDRIGPDRFSKRVTKARQKIAAGRK